MAIKIADFGTSTMALFVSLERKHLLTTGWNINVKPFSVKDKYFEKCSAIQSSRQQQISG